MKKLLSLCLLVIVAIGIGTTANASPLTLNYGNVEFNKLLVVENGISYIPLRFAFTQNMTKDFLGYDPNYGIIIEPHVDEKYVEVGMRRKDGNGQLVDNGRYVKIEWNDEVKYSDDYWATGNGRITFIKYDVINGVNEINYNRDYEIYKGLENQIKLIPVDETGDRLFLSLGDIEKIIDFMTDGNNYQVDIITE